MIKFRTTYGGAAILGLVVLLQSCISGKQLVTQAAVPGEVKGSYTLLLYGCHYPEDIKNVAILVDESGKYPLEIYDIPTSYKVKKGVLSEQALREADSFVRCGTHRIWQTGLRKILVDSGGVIGYEVRPLYFPLEFGIPDVLQISYALKNGAVKAYIRLDPDVERALEGNSLRDRDSSGNK